MQTQSLLSLLQNADYSTPVFKWLLLTATLLGATFLVNFLVGTFGQSTKDYLRKQQSLKNIKASAIKKKLETYVNEKEDINKRYKTQAFLEQTGYNITVADYRLMGWSLGIGFGLLGLLILQNIFVAITFFILGFMGPGQYLSVIRSRRLNRMENQVNAFMNLYKEYYKTTKSPSRALEDCLLDFEGLEPLNSELKRTLLEINLGSPTLEAMNRFARRTGNAYLERMVSYLTIAEHIGTDEVRERLLTQAVLQSRKHRTRKMKLKKEISSPVMESYILLGGIPAVMLFQAVTSDMYVDFMFNTELGKGSFAVLLLIFVGSILFINKKIAAPID